MRPDQIGVSAETDVNGGDVMMCLGQNLAPRPCGNLKVSQMMGFVMTIKSLAGVHMRTASF